MSVRGESECRSTIAATANHPLTHSDAKRRAARHFGVPQVKLRQPLALASKLKVQSSL